MTASAFTKQLLPIPTAQGWRERLGLTSGLSSDDITNNSSVAGATVTDALDQLGSDVDDLEQQIQGIDESIRPIRVTPLPYRANGIWKWNETAHIQDNITTQFYNGKWVQYVAWVDHNYYPCIARRELPDGPWTQRTLNTLSGNPLASPMADDSHNTLNLGCDSNGRIHLSGNHHNNTLRYIRSTNPDDIMSWTTPGMTGSNENSVTYPQFVRTRTGTLLFFYRNGVSGDGNLYLNRFNPGSNTWSAVHHPFINGLASAENPYLWHIAVDINNRIHVMWCFRDTGDRHTNRDMCYAYSDDEGTTWKRTNGTTYSMPITRSNADIVLPTAPTNSGLINQCGLETDSEGRPHCAIFLYVSGIIQLHHLWLDAGTWQVRQVSNFPVDTVDGVAALSRPSVFVTPDDKVYFFYVYNYGKLGGSVRATEVTPGVEQFPTFRILDLDLNRGEPVFDTQALYLRQELHMLVHPATNGLNTNIEMQSMWRNHMGLVCSFDLRAFGAVQAGRVPLPRIEIVSTSGVNVRVDVTTGSPVATNAKIALPSDVLEQGIPFVRHQVRGALQSGSNGTVTVRILETDEENSNDAVLGEVLIKTVAPQNRGSPWIPLRLLSDLDYNSNGGLTTGYLNGQVYWSGTGLGFINIHNMQYGILRLG